MRSGRDKPPVSKNTHGYIHVHTPHVHVQPYGVLYMYMYLYANIQPWNILCSYGVHVYIYTALGYMYGYGLYYCTAMEYIICAAIVFLYMYEQPWSICIAMVYIHVHVYNYVYMYMRPWIIFVRPWYICIYSPGEYVQPWNIYSHRIYIICAVIGVHVQCIYSQRRYTDLYTHTLCIVLVDNGVSRLHLFPIV